MSRVLCHQNSGRTSYMLRQRYVNSTFLGYVISSTGITMDGEKVSAVTTWPSPQSVDMLQRFLGFLPSTGPSSMGLAQCFFLVQLRKPFSTSSNQRMGWG